MGKHWETLLQSNLQYIVSLRVDGISNMHKQNNSDKGLSQESTLPVPLSVITVAVCDVVVK